MRPAPVIRAIFATLILGAGAFAGIYPDPVGLAAAQNAPASPSGRVLIRSGGHGYLGSGLATGAGSVLTAAHMLYDPTGGWSTRVRFEYERYGDSVVSTNRATTLYIMAGYRNRASLYGADSRRSFARDMAGFNTEPIVGLKSTAPWASNGLELLASALQKVSLGYGGDNHDGRTLLSCGSTDPFYSLKGAYYFNDVYYLESGMSGGPVLVNTAQGWFVAGVNVSGSVVGSGVGVRGIDEAAAAFIDTYLSQ